MTGFEPARVSSGKFRASIRVRPKSTPLDHSGTLSRGRRARRRRRARRGWGLRGRAVARGGARDSRPSERARRSRVRIERWIHARYVLMMIYEGETGTEDDHGDGGAAETLAARDAGVERGRLLQSPLHALDQSGVFLRIRRTMRASSVVERRARAAREGWTRASRVDGAHQGVALARLRRLRERVRLPDDPACARALARDARDASVDGRARRSRVAARASGAGGRARSSRARTHARARATHLARTGPSSPP